MSMTDCLKSQNRLEINAPFPSKPWPGDYGPEPGTPASPPIPTPPLLVAWDPANLPPVYGPVAPAPQRLAGPAFHAALLMLRCYLLGCAGWIRGRA